MVEPAPQTQSVPSEPEHGRPMQMRAKNLHKSFGGQTVLDGVSLELRKGEVVLLRGANGSGKTTLLNILSGHLSPDEGGIEIETDDSSTQFSFPRSWWQKVNPFDVFLPEHLAQKGVGRTWQDIRLFSTQSLRDNVAVATPNQKGENPFWALLRPLRTRQEEQKNRQTASDHIASLGLDGRQSSSADKISLGQAKRVAILRAVQAGAEILFLDEPLAGLDAPGISDVMELLQELARAHDITLVIVEHVFNIPRILDLASTVWSLDEGALTSEPAAEVTPSVNESRGIDNQLKHAADPNQVENISLPGGAVLSKLVPEGQSLGPTVLELEEVLVRRGRRLVIGEEAPDDRIRGISFQLHQNEWGILEAPNGWGKTTLFEAIAGTLSIARGKIHLEGEPAGKTPPWNRSVSMLQAQNFIFPTLTVREMLRLAGIETVPEYLQSLIDRRGGSLSGGEKQKVGLACALGQNDTALQLLDEPLSALDTDSIQNFIPLLKENARGRGVLLAVPSMNP